MIDGEKEMIPSIIRIITSGGLAEGLIQTGSAAKIADQIVKLLGEKPALFALALGKKVKLFKNCCLTCYDWRRKMWEFPIPLQHLRASALSYQA